MELALKVKDKAGKVKTYATFENKDLFVSAVGKTYERRVRFGSLSNKDEIVSAFSQGATIGKKDFDVLARALRFYDEVYLCNELCEIIEGFSPDIEFISLGEIGAPFDLSNFEV